MSATDHFLSAVAGLSGGGAATAIVMLGGGYSTPENADLLVNLTGYATTLSIGAFLLNHTPRAKTLFSGLFIGAAAVVGTSNALNSSSVRQDIAPPPAAPSSPAATP